jgi:hypothetical protein
VVLVPCLLVDVLLGVAFLQHLAVQSTGRN